MAAPHALDGLLPVIDFAEQVDRCEATIKRWVKKGLPVVHIGRSVYIDPIMARQWFLDGMPPQPRRAGGSRPRVILDAQ
jgi:hypothetical protein